MLPLLLPALASGAMGLIGGAMQNSAASAAADKQMAFQDRSNERQMAFQKESAQNSYQWAMDDMRRSGLNPILAYKQGGASTLSGASSAGSSYTPQNIGSAAVSAATSGASTALQASRNQAELANIAADTALKGSQDKTQSAMQIQALAQAGQANANSALASAQTNNSVMQYDLMREQLIQAMPASQRAMFETKWLSSPEGQLLQSAERWKNALSPYTSTAKGIGQTIMTGR
ncbi:DNA pilot protein [robinz microvirus RP_160]|nr:DNA pilot protein [robinz microvirus RP_160]